MLVLSRQAQETVVFPSLGISIQVLRSSQNNVRLGIDAPREIAVLRGEIANTSEKAGSTHIAANLIAKSMLPKLRETIHEAAATLNQLHTLADASNNPKCESAIFKLFGHLRELDSKVSGLSTPSKQTSSVVRALLVDDNDNESRLLSSYLKIKGIEVTTAKDGLDAMQRISQNEPDIVLLDMTMPRFDGRWTIDRIRKDQSLEDITVFAVSGTDQADSDVEVGPLGVNGWFRKPLNPDDLILEITNTCKQKRHVAELAELN
jgi:carbon storage regulator CsrA